MSKIYQYIRISQELTVPNTAHFMWGVPSYCIIQGREPIELGPSMEARLRAWNEGTVDFPVNINGVLDLETGWSEREAARYAMTSPNEGDMVPLVDGFWVREGRQTANSQPLDAIAKVPIPTVAMPELNLPLINFDKVRERVQR